MKNQESKTNYIILFILIFEVLALLLFHIIYIRQFEFKGFMSTLETKIQSKNETFDDNTFTKFEELFGHYYDNAGIGFSINMIISFLVMILTIIALIIFITRQFCEQCEKRKKCKNCLDYLLPVYCCLNMMYYIYLAVIAKYKLNLPDEDIYSFDDDFNKEIKENIEFMLIRKITLFCCSIFIIVGIICQFLLIICKKKYKTYQDNIDNLRPSLETIDLDTHDYNIN